MVRVTAEDRRHQLLSEISTALVDHPDLRVVHASGFPIIVEGSFVLESAGEAFDAYGIRIELGERFPLAVPIVRETAGRIPSDIDRHASSDLCLEVWPVWMAAHPSATFKDVLEGPIRNFLLSQTIFERKGEWPFGERAHGHIGVIDAVSELLGIDPPSLHLAAASLFALRKWPKGHRACLCGSKARFRDCHRPKLESLKADLPDEIIDELLNSIDYAYRIEKALAEAATSGQDQERASTPEAAE